MVGFAGNAHQCLRLLLDYTPDVARTVETALSAPISIGDTEGCRLLLEAGADPRRYVEDPPCPAVYAAVRSACSAELVQLLLAHGADPDAPGPDGRSPYRLAVGRGRSDLAAVLRQAGARDDATDIDRLLSACLRADHADAQQLVADHPGIIDRLTDTEHGAAIVQAAAGGSTAAVELMLELGFSIEARGGGNGGTALHAAATPEAPRPSGSCSIVVPTSRPATLRGTARPWSGPPSAAGNGPNTTPRRTGSRPCES